MWRYVFLVLLFLLPPARAAESKDLAYDPLAMAAQQAREPLDLTFTDAARKREIPIRVYLPAETAAAPVVLFSHGLGGSRQGSPYLGEQWAARGYTVVYIQHAGSDDGVWKNLPPLERMAALQKAAGVQNFLLRTKD